MLADRRLYLDATMSRLVNECDAAFLLAAKGHEIAPDAVKRLDLHVWSDGRVMQGPEPVQAWEQAPVEPEPVVPDEPLADVVPAVEVEEPKPKRSTKPRQK